MTVKRAGSILVSATLAAGLSAAAQAAPDNVPMNAASEVQGVQVACAGVGERDEHNPRWMNYPVKLEFVGGYGQYLAGERVALHGGRAHAALDLRCNGPWLLMRLSPGHYHATAAVPGAPAKHFSFTVPAHGRRHVVVRYPTKREGEPQAPQI